MKKLLVICFLLQAPCLLFAQLKDTSLNAINIGLNKLVTSFRVNGHLSVFLTDNHHKKYELTAVNDSPAIAWHAQIKGNVLTAGSFKNHIIVIAYTTRSLHHGKAHDFSAFIFDPATGRKSGEKLFYTSDTGKYERAFSFTITENNFRLVVKDEGMERGKYHAFDKPTLFSHSAPFYTLPRYAITHQVQVFNYNEQLKVTSVDNFAVEGSLVGYDFDKKGDLMVAMFNDNDIQVDKFIAGKSTPVNSIKTGVGLVFSLGWRNTPHIMVAASPASPGVLFYAIEANTRTVAEFRLGKVNFADNTHTSVVNKFAADEFKSMAKNYVPVNNDIGKVDFLKTKDMDLADLLVSDDKIIVPMQANFYNSYGVGDQQSVNVATGAALYNVFNTDLKPLFKAVLPASGSADGDRSYGENHHIDTKNNKLYILSTVNQKTDYGLYAVLDLNSGRWDKMEITGKMDEELSLFDAVWLKNVLFIPRIPTSTFWAAKTHLDLEMKRY